MQYKGIELKAVHAFDVYEAYTKADDTERRLVFKNPKIRIGTGRPEWGAEPGKNYFVISWGE